MKILSFSYCYPNHLSPNWGIFVHHRLKALSRIEELQVCSPVPWFPWFSERKGSPGPEKDVCDGVSVHRPRFYFPGILKNQDARLYGRGVYSYISELCRSWKPDILDAHFIWPDGVGISSVADRLKIPFVITLRGKLYECLKVPSQKRQCTEALKKAAAVISVSGPMADEALKLGADPRKVHIIPNGIDPERLHIRDKMECRRRLGLPENKKILLTVAHLGHRKGHHEVIESLKGLPDNVILVIIGGAAQGGTVKILQQKARECGVENRVFLLGHQPFDKIPFYFSASDASVLASYREGCPNAVLESLACGTPVVASEVGAVRDILPIPETGCIVPPRQVSPLREALDVVLSRDWNPVSVREASKVQSWEEVAKSVQVILLQSKKYFSA